MEQNTNKSQQEYSTRGNISEPVKVWKCVLCEKHYTEENFGHNNADPLADGECCHTCQMYRVIPARQITAIVGNLTHPLLETRLQEIEKYLHVVLGAEGFNVKGQLDDFPMGPPPWKREE